MGSPFMRFSFTLSFQTNFVQRLDSLSCNGNYFYLLWTTCTASSLSIDPVSKGFVFCIILSWFFVLPAGVHSLLCAFIIILKLTKCRDRDLGWRALITGIANILSRANENGDKLDSNDSLDSLTRRRRTYMHGTIRSDGKSMGLHHYIWIPV